ncbi:beta-glucosidase family protein [Sphingosinicella microcystinivorans]|uniref:beta-glucosidase family protein n=1 Tax=Sphingosinicella microcystinivorans TaxID=335406 RepID=UPI0022F3D5DC|nr:glycoside hydrolase family 3 C-terminal domain-containing protein [Sphingosinicella microcystinivorans]WBX84546.1 glycoside hydrolase family 3 C-terminal domain-containing protein [Sphingosinicella microcystinivorans]
MRLGLCGAVFLVTHAAVAVAEGQPQHAGDPDRRAASAEAALVGEERVRLLNGIMALPFDGTPIPEGVPFGAGYIRGVERLGIPALTETDASLGVSYVGGARGDGATALPSGLAMGSTWNPELMREGGALIAGEAHAKGFNVLLAGGINLVRDPRGGRNFEYLGEDPLHSGLLGGAAVKGIQSRHVISTVKHFALNPTETGRQFHNAIIEDGAFRMSDLLAFEIAIEQGDPGSVMCAYNKVNGAQACGSDTLLNKVLKRDWGYKGWVMSDWGAVRGTDFALAGLDQQSGAQLDASVFFGQPLLDASQKDRRYRSKVADMNRRVLRSIYAVGVDANPPERAPVDFAKGAAVAQRIAEQGMVLLQNRDNILPLAASANRILVVGGYADAGVLSGGGSSQTQGEGGPVVSLPVQAEGMFASIMAQNFHRSSPLKAIRARAPKAEVVFRDGRYASEAALAAKSADLVIVFATQWMTEGFDVPDLSLPTGQDEVIAAVARANPNTVVVLQTGGPVAMPWRSDVAAILEAWYPGARGGEAVAAVLFGDVNPSGRLPVTFPASVAQLPRPALPGADTVEPDFSGHGKPGQTLDIDYNIEGADVGYRWFARKGEKPLFPFGFGLSYTRFERSALTVTGGNAPVASFTIRNSGSRAGADIGQVYLIETPHGKTRRLVGFSRVDLQPGEARTAEVPIDPRLLAEWTPKGWKISAGTYRFALGASAEDLLEETAAQLTERTWNYVR